MKNKQFIMKTKSIFNICVYLWCLTKYIHILHTLWFFSRFLKKGFKLRVQQFCSCIKRFFPVNNIQTNNPTQVFVRIISINTFFFNKSNR